MTTTQMDAPATVAVPTRRKPGRSPAQRTALRLLRRVPVWILVAVLMVVVLYPQVWMVLGSFKTQAEFLSNPALSLPETWQFDNYISALTNGNVGQNYLNSIMVTIPSVLLIVFIGVAAGYALEVMIWKGRNGTLLYILAGIMVPGQMILV
ncbi:MAG TPA: carbohydrate ABC transporter permease, partial [Microbacterium sp.]|nr:carbohydrate ABC transporter permease [Microbacterium sp.]